MIDYNDVLLDGLHLMDKNGSGAIIRSNGVGPDFLDVMGVPILQGRDISGADTAASPHVAIVNATFVKRFLLNTNPLGHKINDQTIIGVAKDSKYTGVGEDPMPMAYYPVLQGLRAGETLHVEVRSAGNPLDLLPTIAKVVH